MSEQRNYSLYPLDHTGKIVDPALLLEAVDDEDAMRQAEARCESLECELWQLTRRIGRVSSKRNGQHMIPPGAGMTMLRGLLGRELDSLDDD